MTYGELYRYLAGELTDRENLANEIRWMVEAFSGRKFYDIDAAEQVSRLPFYKKAVARLKHHEPFQYVVGSQDFYGRTFFVNYTVLVPRPETELLCEEAIRWGKGRELKCLDLCTGSGCIAITLASELKGTFLGTDISTDVLETAEKNNRLNGTYVHFEYSDLFFHLRKGETFDLITANPPYLTQQEMTEIPLEVTHEPYIALDGGPTGIYAIERILKEINSRLNSGGLFLMEIGEKQGQTVLDLMVKYGLEGAEILKDLNQKDRILRWEKP